MQSVQFTESCEERPEFHPWLNVHLEHPNRGPPNSRASQNQGILSLEMILPPVPARVKQPRQFTSIGINSRQIGSFGTIADTTGESQIP